MAFHHCDIFLTCDQWLAGPSWFLSSFLISFSLLFVPHRLPYSGYFGGVSGLSKTQFLKINGFPNEYWGWGGEDDDIFNRWASQAKIFFFGMDGFNSYTACLFSLVLLGCVDWQGSVSLRSLFISTFTLPLP